jgi:hypothetical protein
MKSPVATTVSGHVFASPKVMSLSTSGSLQPLVAATAAQDAPRLDPEAVRHPLWAIEFAATA